MLNGYIHRAPRDKLHPYMQLYRKLVQDTSVEAEARLLIIYILSLPENSTTDIVSIGKKNGWGRDKTRRLVKVLESHGYCEKEIKRDKGKFDFIVYSFHEEKIYKILDDKEIDPEPENKGVAQEPCEPQTENPSTANQFAAISPRPPGESLENSTSTIYTLDKCSKRKEEERRKEEEEKEPPNVGSSPPSFEKPPSSSKKQSASDEAIKLAAEIVQILTDQALPGWNASNSHLLPHHCDYYLKAGATYQQIINALLWALKDAWWREKLYSKNMPRHFRENLPSWFAKMTTPAKEAPRKFAPSSDQKRAEENVRKMFTEGVL